jgi:hypothetical protein
MEPSIRRQNKPIYSYTTVRLVNKIEFQNIVFN